MTKDELLAQLQVEVVETKDLMTGYVGMEQFVPHYAWRGCVKAYRGMLYLFDDSYDLYREAVDAYYG